MSLITIKICTDGDAFQDNPSGQIIRLLGEEIKFPIKNQQLTDSNGNPCGTVEVRESEE